MTAWDTLYRALREPLSGVCYRLDSELRRVRVDGSEVTGEFADGYTAQGNFLVGADGIGSATRGLLDPGRRPAYAGYVAWRGLEPESSLPADLLALLVGRFTFFGSARLRPVAAPDDRRPYGVDRRCRWNSPPHTASGTSKAFADAAGLAAAMRGWTPGQDLPAGRLADWERERLSYLVALSRAGIDLANRSTLGTANGCRFFVSARHA
ncbi:MULTISPECIES: hypothetical protein [Streptomyces]|nr:MULTISPECIES: hypothetical protein [Streptomyces]